MDKITEQPKKENSNTPRYRLPAFWLIILLIAGFFLLPTLMGDAAADKEISWQTFQNEMLSRNAIEKMVIINKEKAEVYIKKEKINDPYFKTMLKKKMKMPSSPVLIFGSALDLWNPSKRKWRKQKKISLYNKEQKFGTHNQAGCFLN